MPVHIPESSQYSVLLLIWLPALCHVNHVTDILASFHWYRLPEWIKFKLLTIVNRLLNCIKKSPEVVIVWTAWCLTIPPRDFRPPIVRHCSSSTVEMPAWWCNLISHTFNVSPKTWNIFVSRIQILLIIHFISCIRISLSSSFACECSPSGPWVFHLRHYSSNVSLFRMFRQLYMHAVTHNADCFYLFRYYTSTAQVSKICAPQCVTARRLVRENDGFIHSHSLYDGAALTALFAISNSSAASQVYLLGLSSASMVLAI
jgi:hypothetical protein